MQLLSAKHLQPHNSQGSHLKVNEAQLGQLVSHVPVPGDVFQI